MPNANEPRFPTHVAIIVDGNRRWAKQRMLPVSVGHKAGFDRLREITRYAVGDRGVFVLSLYVFSTENFSRDAKEVGYLMDLFANNFRTIADEMNERGCKVLFSGRREGLQQRVLDAMDYMMDLTKDNEKGIVNFCLNYGSHAELTDATRAIAAEVKAGTLAPEAIDEKVIEKHIMEELPFMATENILMDAVKRGGDRQALHERIRTHSLAAGSRVKDEGKDNDLLERIAADPAFGLSKEEVLRHLNPADYIGCCPHQVERFLAEYVRPVQDRYPHALEGTGAEIKV